MCIFPWSPVMWIYLLFWLPPESNDIPSFPFFLLRSSLRNIHTVCFVYAIIVMFIFMHTIHPLSEGRKQRPEDRFSLQAEFRTSIEYSATWLSALNRAFILVEGKIRGTLHWQMFCGALAYRICNYWYKHTYVYRLELFDETLKISDAGRLWSDL